MCLVESKLNIAQDFVLVLSFSWCMCVCVCVCVLACVCVYERTYYRYMISYYKIATQKNCCTQKIYVTQLQSNLRTLGEMQGNKFNHRICRKA